ncbi:hypothetical protein [Nonomuraea bangladeshensis]|uniref:hypothetical protein n=1 Tax=Nonomuraea bangladeshensis TaxID=404385 RepID=UPI0031D5C625
MKRDLVRGGGVGLVVGAFVGCPVSRLYLKDVDSYTVLPLLVMAVAAAVPFGVLLGVWLRITRPLRGALLAVVLLVVLKNAVDLVVPSPSPRLAFAGFVVLAIVSCAGGAVLAGTAALMPRVVAAVVVCGCVVTTATVEQQRTEAFERRLRADTVASYEKSLPLAVPEVVPGRVLVQVWTIGDDVLALDYARGQRSEADVFVRISAGGDPEKACAEWERDFGSCRPATADRWFTKKGANGRQVLFAKVDGRLVEVDSAVLGPDEALVVAGGLRAVSAEYLVDFELPRDGWRRVIVNQ